MLPKNDGAITMYHVLLRHLSRMCFADFAGFEDKLISPRRCRRFSSQY
jgi:hypothetical protein